MHSLENKPHSPASPGVCMCRCSEGEERKGGRVPGGPGSRRREVTGPEKHPGAEQRQVHGALLEEDRADKPLFRLQQERRL